MNTSFLEKLKSKIPAHIKPEFGSYEELRAFHKKSELNEEYFLRQKADWLVRNSGMSDKFKSCSFESFVVSNEGQSKALAYSKRYEETFSEQLKTGKGFMFVGNAGTGKNHLASSIANNLIAKKYSVLIITISDLIKMVRDSWSKNTALSETQVMSNLASVDLLIIDEVGLQRGTDDEKLHLTKIIDKRLYSFKPTSIISNCTNSEEIKEYIGFRAYDRLKEGSLFALEFNWDSHRGSAK